MLQTIKNHIENSSFRPKEIVTRQCYLKHTYFLFEMRKYFRMNWTTKGFVDCLLFFYLQTLNV